MIFVQGLTKRFGSTVALDGVTFQVSEGEVFGFVGPNGAGKTTTMRILAGLTRPSSGTAVVDGIDAGDDPAEIRDRIGYMPDFFGVYDRLTAGEYLAFYASCHRIARNRIAGTVSDLLELVGLSAKREAAVDTLSRGMKQRLCLARALVHDPRVLLLDEPASGLDPRARAEMRELVLELAAMGKTVLLSSHILPELAEMCTTYGIMDSGRIVASGTVDALAGSFARQVARVGVLGDSRLVSGKAAELPGVLSVASAGEDLAITYEGGLEEAAAVLAGLVAAGVRVVSFVPTANDLEDVFLRLTDPGEAL
jgi:ABC-2 type transport system ATP-binding protein